MLIELTQTCKHLPGRIHEGSDLLILFLDDGVRDLAHERKVLLDADQVIL